jgi:hypothetical protein
MIIRYMIITRKEPNSECDVMSNGMSKPWFQMTLHIAEGLKKCTSVLSVTNEVLPLSIQK